MIPRALAASALATLLLGCEAPPQPAPPPAATGAPAGVAADAALRERLGLALEPLAAATFLPAVEGFGTVLPVEPAIELDAERRTAEAASAASGAALARAEALFAAEQATSLASLEAARHQAALDSIQRQRAESRLALAWGVGSPLAEEGVRRRWLERLASGRATLAQLRFPLGSTLPAGPLTFSVSALGGGASWRAHPAWPGPADPALPGPSYLALLTGERLPQPGEALRVWAEGGPAEVGVLVPATAVLLADGGSWAYVESGERLRRRALPLTRPQAGGYFVAQGFQAGERVVVEGAGLLLALETGSLDPDAEEEE